MTWSEIFFLASLKRIPLTNAFPVVGTDWQTLDGELLFHKAPYNSPWLTSLNSWLATAIENWNERAINALIGESGLVAHRLMGMATAMLTFVCMFPLLTVATSRIQPQQNPPIAPQQQVLSPLRFAPATAAFFLVLFVRLGGVEQLFFAAGLALVAQMKTVSSLDSKIRFELRQCILTVLAAAAFACTNSRGWIYPLAISAGVWSTLHTHARAATLRSIIVAGLTVCIFSALFLGLSDVQAFVSHLTQRWLYLNEPRYLAIQWPGSSLVWSALAIWFALMCLPSLMDWSLNARRSVPPPFVDLLCLSAAINFAYFQKTPQTVDLILLGGIFFSVRRQSTNPAQTLSGWKKHLKRAIQTLPLIYALGLLLGLMLGLAVMFLPETHIVPALRAVLNSAQLLLSEHTILCFVCGGLFLAAVYLSMRSLPSVNETRSPQSAFLISGTFLLCASEIRSAYIWTHLKQTLTAAPVDAQILYLPRLEPLVQLLPPTEQKKRMVTIFEGESMMYNQPRSMLLVSSEASEVCRSASWNIQSNRGIFSLCDVGQGTLVHLFPLN